MTATIVESAFVTVTGSTSVTMTFSAPAVGSEVLVMLFVNSGGDSVSSVDVDGVSRNMIAETIDLRSLSFGGNSSCTGVVVALNPDDETATANLASLAVWGVFAWAIVDGTPMIPTDWILYYDTRDETERLRTQSWDAFDTGLYLCVATANGLVDPLLEPVGWTDLGSVSTLARTAQFATGPITAEGFQAPNYWQDGVVPAGATGESYWFAPYDLGLRIRDAGIWLADSGVTVSRGGASEPPARQFPALGPLPNLPPDGPGIVVPTPPWIPDTPGPYRAS